MCDDSNADLERERERESGASPPASAAQVLTLVSLLKRFCSSQCLNARVLSAPRPYGR